MSINVFSLFGKYLDKSEALHLNKPEFLSPKDALYYFDWNCPIGSGDEDLLISSMYFRRYLPLEKGETHHLNKP